MKIIISILLNAVILYVIVVLLWDWQVTLWCWDTCSANSIWAWQTFIVWWLVLWIINITIRPILKILSFPFFILSFWLISLFINALTLWILTYILNNILQISGIWYTINWWINFIIAVFIFTVFNMVYSLLFFKK